MEFTTFVRKPFKVEAVEVTTNNIGDIAEFVGTLRHKDNGTPYIQVDRRLVPNVFRVYPGFWMTKMGDNIRCYSKRVFEEQFIVNTDEINQWVNFMNESHTYQDEDVEEEVEQEQEPEERHFDVV
jgi:hypothetical protein